MKDRTDYSKYECPYSHCEKECGHELHGPEGYEDTYGVWCECGYRAPVFSLDPEKLGLKLKGEPVEEAQVEMIHVDSDGAKIIADYRAELESQRAEHRALYLKYRDMAREGEVRIAELEQALATERSLGDELAAAVKETWDCLKVYKCGACHSNCSYCSFTGNHIALAAHKQARGEQ